MKKAIVIRGGSEHAGKQGLSYSRGISAESAGSVGLCLHTLVIPAGGRAEPHLHEGHESAIYLISGACKMWSGDRLEQHHEVATGDFVYIPAGVPHLPVNASDTDPAVCVIARTDPNDQESVVLLGPDGTHI